MVELERQTIDVGLMEGDSFVSMTDGASLPIVEGFQPGYWVMPAVQLAYVLDQGVMSGELRTVDNDLVGEISVRVRLSPYSGASYRLDYFAIPVVDAGEFPVEELYGKQVNMTIGYEDECGTSMTLSHLIVLVESA